MRYLRELIIAVLLIAGGYFLWQSLKKDERIEQFEKNHTTLQSRYDSVIEVSSQTAMYAMRLHTEMNVLKQEKKAEAVMREVYRYKYERLKNNHPKMLTDSAIVAELSGLWPR